jgi:hypothetical protein
MIFFSQSAKPFRFSNGGFRHQERAFWTTDYGRQAAASKLLI